MPVARPRPRQPPRSPWRRCSRSGRWAPWGPASARPPCPPRTPPAGRGPGRRPPPRRSCPRPARRPGTRGTPAPRPGPRSGRPSCASSACAGGPARRRRPRWPAAGRASARIRSVELGPHGPGGVRSRSPPMPSSAMASSSSARRRSGRWRPAWRPAGAGRPRGARHQHPQALRPQRAGPVAPAHERALQVGEHAGHARPAGRPARGSAARSGPSARARGEQLLAARPVEQRLVEGVDEQVGVAADRTRKWPGMPTPSAATPTRRATSMNSTDSVMGMPARRSSTSSSSELRGLA